MKRNNAFTLAELLIVMGIIVLIVAVAVPSFRAITGGRSTEAAQNQLSAFIGRARAEAIGVQEIRGVAFILNSDTQAVTGVMVREVAGPNPRPAGQANVAVYLDAVPDRDSIALPAGVGIQTIDNAAITPPAALATPNPGDDVRGDDAYIGMNVATVNGSTFHYGGVILFDAFGRLVDRQYAFLMVSNGAPSNLASLWQATGAATTTAFKPGAPGDRQPRSSVGFVLYDLDAFNALEFNAADPQFDSTLPAYADISADAWNAMPEPKSGRSDEAKEERWIDENATALLVNRNNGTLLRAQ